MIIVSRPDKVEEIRRAPDDVLSTIDAAKEVWGLCSSQTRNDIWPKSRPLI